MTSERGPVRSYEDAIAAVSAPGQPFEVVEVERRRDQSSLQERAADRARILRSRRGGSRRRSWSTRTRSGPSRGCMDEADALGHALVHHYGVKKGDRVGIAMRNYPEWVISFAAILSVGAVSVSLNAWWTEEELDYAIDDAGLSLLIGDPERVRSRRAPVQRRAPRSSACASASDGVAPRVERWEDVVVRGDEPCPRSTSTRDMRRDDPLHLGHDGISQGCRLDPWGDQPGDHGVLVGRLGAGGATRTAKRSAPVSPPCLHLDRAALSRDRMHPGHDVVLRLALQTRDDVPLGTRARARNSLSATASRTSSACRPRPGTSWSRRNFADYDTSSLTRGRRRRRAGAADPRGARRALVLKGRPNLGYGMTETNAYGPGNYGDDYVTHPTSTGHGADDRDGRGDARRVGPRARARRERRDLVEVADAHSRVLAQARGDGRDHRRRLAAHRRPRAHRAKRATSTSRTARRT